MDPSILFVVGYKTNKEVRMNIEKTVLNKAELVTDDYDINGYFWGLARGKQNDIKFDNLKVKDYVLFYSSDKGVFLASQIIRKFRFDEDKVQRASNMLWPDNKESYGNVFQISKAIKTNLGITIDDLARLGIVSKATKGYGKMQSSYLYYNDGENESKGSKLRFCKWEILSEIIANKGLDHNEIPEFPSNPDAKWVDNLYETLASLHETISPTDPLNDTSSWLTDDYSQMMQTIDLEKEEKSIIQNYLTRINDVEKKYSTKYANKKLTKKVVKQQRTFQRDLRKGMLDLFETDSGLVPCAICGRLLPSSFVCCSHIEKFTDLKNENDEENIKSVKSVLPMCYLGCDKLFEDRFVRFDVDSEIVKLNKGRKGNALQSSSDLLDFIKKSTLAIYNEGKKKDWIFKIDGMKEVISDLYDKYSDYEAAYGFEIERS